MSDQWHNLIYAENNVIHMTSHPITPHEWEWQHLSSKDIFDRFQLHTRQKYVTSIPDKDVIETSQKYSTHCESIYFLSYLFYMIRACLYICTLHTDCYKSFIYLSFEWRKPCVPLENTEYFCVAKKTLEWTVTVTLKCKHWFTRPYCISRYCVSSTFMLLFICLYLWQSSIHFYAVYRSVLG